MTLHERIAAFLSHHDRCRPGFIVDDSTVADFVEGELSAAESRLAIEASRADVAEQMVCEMRLKVQQMRTDGAEAIREAHMRGIGDGHPLTAKQEGVADIIADFVGSDAALALTEPVAGRWVSREDHDRVVRDLRAAWAGDNEADRNARIGVAMAERDDAIARAEKAEARLDENIRLRITAENRTRDITASAIDSTERSINAKRARDEVGIQLVAAQERLRLAMGLRDFAESPPIHWHIAEDRQTITGRLDDATATLVVDGRVELRRDDGVLLARIDVHSHDGPVSGVLMDRADSQCEIAAALLWSHRRSNKIDAVNAWDTVPGDALAAAKFLDVVKTETLAAISERMHVPPGGER